MRSSGRTTVSRTRVRIDSVRRRRRGRRVIAPVVVSLDGIVGIEVFVVIGLSIEERSGAGGRAEAAAYAAIRAVGAEVSSADDARFEASNILGVLADHALPFIGRRHGSRNFYRAAGLSIIPRLVAPGRVRSLFRRCSSDG